MVSRRVELDQKAVLQLELDVHGHELFFSLLSKAFIRSSPYRRLWHGDCCSACWRRYHRFCSLISKSRSAKKNASFSSARSVEPPSLVHPAGNAETATAAQPGVVVQLVIGGDRCALLFNLISKICISIALFLQVTLKRRLQLVQWFVLQLEVGNDRHKQQFRSLMNVFMK